jgi:hypothetical protein
MIRFNILPPLSQTDMSKGVAEVYQLARRV